MKPRILFVLTCVCTIWLATSSAWAGKTVSHDTKGTTTFAVSVISADVVIAIGPKGKAIMTVDGKVQKIDLVPSGNVLRAKIERKKMGNKKMGNIERVRVTLPAGMHVEVRTISGNVKVGALAGDTNINAVSGDVSVEAASKLEVKTVSGDVTAKGVRGATRVKTVSGDVSVHTKGKAASSLDFASTSGDINWFGMCAKDCLIHTQTLSGDTTLHLDQASSVRVRFRSFSGDINDKLGLGAGQKSGGHGPRRFDAVYKQGDGLVDCSTHSGDLNLRKQ